MIQRYPARIDRQKSDGDMPHQKSGRTDSPQPIAAQDQIDADEHQTTAAKAARARAGRTWPPSSRVTGRPHCSALYFDAITGEKVLIGPARKPAHRQAIGPRSPCAPLFGSGRIGVSSACRSEHRKTGNDCIEMEHGDLVGIRPGTKPATADRYAVRRRPA